MRARPSLAVAALTAALLLPTGTPAHADAAPATTAPATTGPPLITDDQGRALILHGLNTAGSAKGPSGLPWITRADVAREARDIGTNSVRYLIQWRNVEPSPGRYDERYLDEVAKRVAWYREQGMHVILDMHQDMYGPSACAGSPGAGDGAPAWASLSDGLPCKLQDPWSLTYLQPGIVRAFDNFWNHTGKHPELMRRYTAMWRHVAARFAKEPAVLGYDLMNEPFGGSRQFAAFEGPTLTSFYQRIVTAIRQVDRDNWIFAEPQVLGPNEGFATALKKISDPRPGGSRVVLAPHFYPLGIDLGGSYTGAAKLLARGQFELWRHNLPASARRLGTPLWIGEVGGIPETAPGALDFTADWLAMADGLGIGWAYWSNDPGSGGVVDGKGDLTGIGRLLARPYPRAVAGTPTKISYSSGKLTVAWRNRSGAHGPTEIWFPSKPRVTSSDPAGRWRTTWDAKRRVLSVWADPKTPSHTVVVSP
ncbi:cellulase family glycosylhydrolase [Actinomadura macrotermitis]|uniref:Endoglycoceramidase n=1 Tax=Actinomadura macrotermitis TaxID=2585200 RepID=A0A7K0C0X9_9ACTN|nr:cellulase family glycosylhydrolase [Actinomadura macrotermitis]MQY07118.1 hypothetical protein [Actinomadura macrotermitis]